MAIAAHLQESRKQTGKLREPRRTLRLEVQGALPSGDPTNVLVHNVSATGLLLESASALAVGETIGIDLPHAGVIRAAVIWASGSLFGCQFDVPISPAALSAAQLRSAAEPSSDKGLGTLAGGEMLDPGESFGARLQRLRKARGLTMAKIAAQLDVSKPTVWAWEHGKARPVESRIERLAHVLGVPSSQLVPGRDSPALQELLATSRERIAGAVGTSPDKVRIMIEL